MGHRSKRYRASTACRLAQEITDDIDLQIRRLQIDVDPRILARYQDLRRQRQEVIDQTFGLLFPTAKRLRTHDRQTAERELSRARFLERPARPKRQHPPHRIAKLLKHPEHLKAGQA